MSELADIISGEFEEAMEIKNPKSLHRGIYLLLSSTVPREDHLREHEALNTTLVKLNNNVELLAVEMKEGFKRMDERFEAVDRRFEAVDRRFEAVDRRFEAVDQRFEDLIGTMNTRFEAVDKRFEAEDKRFADLISTMNNRFEAVDRRFDRLTTLLVTLIPSGFLLITALITIFHFIR